MTVALLDEHVTLAEVVRAFALDRDLRSFARASLDGADTTPAFWSEIAEMGWLGLHLPEEMGGSGYGLLELAVVASELGREVAPGPLAACSAVAGAIAAAGTTLQQSTWIPGLLDGSSIAALGVAGTLTLHDRTLGGRSGPVLGTPDADLIALTVGDDLVVLDRRTPWLTLQQRDALDPTQPSMIVHGDGVIVPPTAVVTGGAARARAIVEVVAIAQAAGGAHACVEMAAAYAKERTAFGRIIGSFQAVKHHLANMLLESQIAAGLAWDAARGDGRTIGRPAGIARALPAFLRCAQLNIQVHGGIGFTWEHDAHLFLRRAAALRALLGPHETACAAVARSDADDADVIELPPEAASIRAAVRSDVEAYDALPVHQRHAFLLDNGYLFPAWPRPWGRGASPVEQVVIEEEWRHVDRLAALGSNQWIVPINVPVLIAHATRDQQERWVRSTLEGSLKWCMLLSEPGAGSDLAAVSTRAVRTDGGWLVTGQKVWTSDAHLAELGAALVRTDPHAPKHRGLTYLVVDMRAPGVSVRPLRNITGASDFNEVFLDEVFVPDENVIGQVNDGWRVAKSGLEAERVSLGTGTHWSNGPDWQAVRERATSSPGALTRFGELLSTARAIHVLNLRATQRAVNGGPAGAEGVVTKLLVAHQAQHIADLALDLAGLDGVFADGGTAPLVHGQLFSRHTTIAGGTSEILRDVLSETVLGLPRDR